MVGDRDTNLLRNCGIAAIDLTIKKLVNGYGAIKTFLVLNGKSDQEIQDITKYDHNAV